MKIIKSVAIVALMGGCAIATIDVRPASALTLMDFIRGGRKRTPEQAYPAQPGYDMYQPTYRVRKGERVA